MVNNSKDSKPLVSVVVPVYNVEMYVKKCLDSLHYQTLKQIEIICIDDGSTDSSGKIVDEFISSTDRWPSFKCFHTSNKGLSAARNKGIDESTADWIMFVDSDDWVHESFCEIPYNTAINNCADMVVFKTFLIKNKSQIIDGFGSLVGFVDELTTHEIAGVSAWRRIYKKELFNNIRFPEGRVYEDVATTHSLIHKANKIYFINDPLYYHVYRKNSISSSSSLDNTRDAVFAEFERAINLLSYGYPEEKLSSSISFLALRYLARVSPNDNDLYRSALDVVNNIDNFKGLSIKQIILLFLFRVNKKAFCFVCELFGYMKKDS